MQISNNLIHNSLSNDLSTTSKDAEVYQKSIEVGYVL